MKKMKKTKKENEDKGLKRKRSCGVLRLKSEEEKKTLNNNHSRRHFLPCERSHLLLIMSDLPKDLVEEILCRVPATYLSQLRYACKRWNRLFTKKRFTRKHLDKAAKQFLVLMSEQCYRVYLMSINFNGVPSVEIKGKHGLTGPQGDFEIFKVSHCDGLLLCNNGEYNRIVVWNPCTGQTRWIQPTKIGSYALGSYQDNEYGNTSYKILSCCDGDKNAFEIYEFNTNLWRTLDVNLDCELEYDDCGMSLKGKTYWFASDENEEQLGMFLVSFDYTTELFARLVLPCQSLYNKAFSLSVVREEKLSVLLKHRDTSRTEIWMTNKIDETKVVSWSKFLTVDLKPELRIFGHISFLVDEEKKFIVLCHLVVRSGVRIKQVVYIVGEDNNVKQVHSGFASSLPNLFDYIPSLTQF
ncbi:PREDICTED: probable F-box protein At5g47300 [Camelina sativa]|uniref:Probable F-box protein At5g47300 n=1 Tax=Camelina sativa TaxID=90675 RepID=A0ABM0ZBK2_CAMSA|nr:PREDICTED: probable F-box protein At5g47300 [Camelina sativa]